MSLRCFLLENRDVELLHLIDVVEQEVLYPDIENTCLIVPADGTKLMQAVCKAIRFAYFFCYIVTLFVCRLLYLYVS